MALSSRSAAAAVSTQLYAARRPRVPGPHPGSQVGRLPQPPANRLELPQPGSVRPGPGRIELRAVQRPDEPEQVAHELAREVLGAGQGG